MMKVQFANGHVSIFNGTDVELADVREVLTERDFKQASDSTWVHGPDLKKYENGMRSHVAPEIVSVDYKFPEGEIPGKPHVSFMSITPALAVLCLARMGRNRNIVRNSLERIKRKLETGEWVQVHQGIAFYFNGKFYDGQHRMAAVVETGVTMPNVSISVNMPLNAYKGTDRGTSKSPDHLIQIMGYDIKNYGGVLKSIIVGVSGPSRQVDDAELIKIAPRVHEGAKFVMKYLRSTIKGMAIVQVKAAIIRAYYSCPAKRENIAKFCDVLTSGFSNGKGCPALAFREWVIKTPGVRDAESCKRAYLMAEKALYQFIGGMDIRRLKPAESELFVLPWETASANVEGTTEDVKDVPINGERSIDELNKIINLDNLDDDSGVIAAGE